MVRNFPFRYLWIIFLFLGACASRNKNQLSDYRDAFGAKNFDKAQAILEKTSLKENQKSILLWELESGSLSLEKGDETQAIEHFQSALDMIDRFYTKKLSSKAASLLLNDASDDFYGASYERSFAHYYLARSYYMRFLKTGSARDLQGARATVLAWDSYFAELSRSAPAKTLYTNDLTLKIFGAQIHEVSHVRNDLQIALQLYKDALSLLNSFGGIFSIYNNKYLEYLKVLEESSTPRADLFEPTLAHTELKKILSEKIYRLTQLIRPHDAQKLIKDLALAPDQIETIKKYPAPNVVILLEEGLIAQKVAKPFNFGIRGAISSVESSSAKAFIATVGVEFLTAFAMNKLGLVPTHTTSPGSFIFAHDMARLAVQEASIEFELPMIEELAPLQMMELFILDERGVIKNHRPVPVFSDNGSLARVVLEEDVVARYTKTGARVALKHLLAIISALQVYRSLIKGNNEGDFLAKTAAMATYLAASKGLTALEKADTRQWVTLPNALRMNEFQLPPGEYQLAIGFYQGNQVPESPTKILGKFQVSKTDKTIFIHRF